MTEKKGPKSSPRIIEAVLAHDLSGLRDAIDAGEDINERDRDGRTALHHASIEADRIAVELLLNSNADASAEDNNGWTPLHFIPQSHRVDIGELLLRAGAAVDASDAHGNTPLFRAVFESRGRGEVIGLLLGAGADKHRKNRHGTSPIDLAERIANFDVKRWLV